MGWFTPRAAISAGLDDENEADHDSERAEESGRAGPQARADKDGDEPWPQQKVAEKCEYPHTRSALFGVSPFAPAAACASHPFG